MVLGHNNNWLISCLLYPFCGIVGPAISYMATKPFEYMDENGVLACEVTVPFTLLLYLMAYISLYLSYPSQSSTQVGPGKPDVPLFSISVLFCACIVIEMVIKKAQMDLSYAEILFTGVVMMVSLLGFASGTSVTDALWPMIRKRV